MSEQSLGFLNQLIEKTEQGKLSWSTGFEDGQFKTLLPGGKLAFVVQVKGNLYEFLMLDDHQEIILKQTITEDESLKTAAQKQQELDGVREFYGNGPVPPAKNDSAHQSKLMIYLKIGKLQELARSQALQVNEKLAKAEQMLAAI